MAELLFISPNDMSKTTLLGHNVDRERYVFCIHNVQLSALEPLLGSELYDKIVADVTAATITGLYETIYEEYVKPITKNLALAEYIEIASYTLDNGGLFKRNPTDVDIVNQEEALYLAGKYKHTAQMYINRFYKFMCKNYVEEYKAVQDEVNAKKDVTVRSGWYVKGVDSPKNDDIFNDLR